MLNDVIEVVMRFDVPAMLWECLPRAFGEYFDESGPGFETIEFAAQLEEPQSVQIRDR